MKTKYRTSTPCGTAPKRVLETGRKNVGGLFTSIWQVGALPIFSRTSHRPVGIVVPDGIRRRHDDGAARRGQPGQPGHRLRGGPQHLVVALLKSEQPKQKTRGGGDRRQSVPLVTCTNIYFKIMYRKTQKSLPVPCLSGGPAMTLVNSGKNGTR